MEKRLVIFKNLRENQEWNLSFQEMLQLTLNGIEPVHAIHHSVVASNEEARKIIALYVANSKEAVTTICPYIVDDLDYPIVAEVVYSVMNYHRSVLVHMVEKEYAQCTHNISPEDAKNNYDVVYGDIVDIGNDTVPRMYYPAIIKTPNGDIKFTLDVDENNSIRVKSSR